jgi:tetratricopeptide (TPR) repeat protein
MVAEGLQQYEEAVKEFAQASGIAADLASMGRVAVRRGDMELGLEYIDRAYRSYAAQGDRMRALEVLSHAVEAARQSGRLDEAKRLEAESASLKAVPASR